MLDHEREQAVLRGHDLLHPPVAGQDADPADPPVQRLAALHEPVQVHGLVGPVEAADAEVHDARADGAAVVGRRRTTDGSSDGRDARREDVTAHTMPWRTRVVDPLGVRGDPPGMSRAGATHGYGDVGSSESHVETARDQERAAVRNEDRCGCSCPRSSRPSGRRCGPSSPPRCRRRSATTSRPTASSTKDAVRPGPAGAQRRRAGRAALAGRVGRPGLDAAAAPHLARGDAAGQRARAAGLQHQHDRPGPRAVRQPGAEGALPGEDGEPRHLVVPGLLRARRRLRPRLAAHHRRPRRRRLGGQRPEDLDDARPVRRLDLLPRAAPTRPRRRSSAASRCWSSRWTPPASRCARSS